MEKSVLQIEKMIYVVRGMKIMLDSDLAELYGIETKKLNQQVRRNIKRFPEDFMFQLTAEEMAILRSQIVTSSSEWGGRRYQPLVFTENGVAMLSSILNSDRAIEVNIAIMRIFTKLRSFLLLEEHFTQKLEEHKEGTEKIFKVVFERLDDLEINQAPFHPEDRKRIGLK